MSRRRCDLTPEEIERAREQDRLRQARRRSRIRSGRMLLDVPADVADELGDDENAKARAIEILRRGLAASFRA